MTLSSGTRIGPYEVFEPIGMGGMGEVYRARDTKLNRDVALKTLPAVVARDGDRLARFRREAHVLASLNHSNIAAIFGFEEGDGVAALILELIDGPTLADRVVQGPIPLDEGIPIAIQITEALEAAHDRGVIHRDLKPANIKVRPDGTVKVLDFGLAKALTSEAAIPDASGSLTITSPALTSVGVILGTAAYMSPEQARGKAADKRSDLWAFGCVLYEMLTGKRAFEGSEVSDTLASILKSEPDWRALPADTPPGVRRVLRRCLEKDPRKRIRDIADVRLELQSPIAEETVGLSPAAVPIVRARERAAWLLALVSLAMIAIYLATLTPDKRSEEVTRFQIFAPPGAVLGRDAVGSSDAGAANATVSPDGTRVVFVASDRDGKAMLWTRALNSFDSVPLPGSEGATQPFWAPDSRALGFFVGNKMKRLDTNGGELRTIWDVVGDIPRGGTWGSSGHIVFAAGASPRLFRVSSEGGVPVPLAPASDGGVAIEALWPHFLPDGQTFLYWARTASEGPGVYAGSIAPGSHATRVLASASNVAYDPAGYLLFSRGGVLPRQRFDPKRFEVRGDAIHVTEGVAWIEAQGRAFFSVSNTGVLVFQPGLSASTQFAWFDRTGRMLETIGRPGSYGQPALSPDGKRLVYEDFRDGNLWMLDIGRNIVSRFTSGPGLKFSPVWSPDGNTIFYRATSESGMLTIFEKSASGVAEQKAFFTGILNGSSQISPDGKWLLYFANPKGEFAQDVFVLPMSGERTPVPVVQSPFAEVEPQFSPDGKFIAYVSSATGRNEVYVQPFPATGERWPVSNSGGRQPLWRKDGKELFFVNDDKKFYAVAVTQGPIFDYGPPQFLFEMRANVYNSRNSYIPSPDGKRFLVNTALDTAASPIQVVRNWTAGLKD